MLDEYIETDILRRVKIIEYLYVHQNVNVRDILNDLSISIQTLRKDIEKVKIQLKDYIEDIHISGGTIQVKFISNYITDINLMTQQLYGESVFLRLLGRFLNGDHSKQEVLANRENISIANAYKYKKSIENFIDKLRLGDSEKRYRTLMLDIEIKTLISREYNLDYKMTQSENIMIALKKNYQSIHLSTLAEQILIEAIYLVFLRNEEHPMNIQPKEYKHLVNDNIFIFFETMFANKNIKNSQSEAAYITMIFYLLVQYKDYVVTQTNQIRHFDNLIESFPDIHRLYISLTSITTHTMIDTLSLKKKLIDTILFIWIGYPFMSCHYLVDQDDPFLYCIESEFRHWNDNCKKYDLHINKNYLLSFYFLYSNILLKYNNYYTCNIITSNQEKFTILFNLFYKYLSSSQFKINSSLFYSFNDIPKELLQYPYIIICDRTLYNKEMEEIDNIFPFSLDNIRNDMKNLINTLLDN